MINLISNDCIGGYFYTFSNIVNGNPFIYHSMNLSNFIKLIENFSTLNFKNISFKIKKQSDLLKNYYNIVEAIIDKTVIFEYTHHIYKNDALQPVLVKQEMDCNYNSVRNVFFKNIIQLVKTNYFVRLSRMNNNPTFVFHDNWYWTDIDIQNLINVNTDNNIIIFTNKNIQSLRNNIKIIQNDNKICPEDCAKILINENHIMI